MIEQNPMVGVDVFGYIFLFLWIFYLSGVAVLNTSMGLRMGYNAYRIIPASVVWPLLVVYEPLDEWAKSGEYCLIE